MPESTTLRASPKELYAILDAIGEAIIVIDEASRCIQYVNQGAATLLGEEAGMLRGSDALRLIADPATFVSELEKLSDDGTSRFELNLLPNQADKIPVQGTFRRLFQHGGRSSLVLVARDLRDTLLAQRKIDWISEHDALTGLLNRHGFLHLLKRQLQLWKRSRSARARSVMVMVLGIDRFRRINEAHGTASADGLLAALSERLIGLLFDYPGALLARLGGDEFAIALSVSGEEEARRIMQWAQHSIELSPFPIASGKTSEQLVITAGAGLTVSEAMHAAEAGELLRQANAALRRAKELGRGHAHRYTVGMLDEESRHQRIEQRLSSALERGAFFLHYQPIWKLDDSTSPSGAEALLRWHDEELGPIGPDVFVPILEESGAMVAVGRWVLDTALDAMQACGSRLPENFVSINVSAVQLMNDGDLADYAIEALRLRDLPASALEIEVTETALIQSPGRVGRQLYALHKAGISIALDDFGTGFSSLSHLKQFPFDTVKIDRSFISGLPNSSKDRAIVESLLRLCQGFERHVCAEGIENYEQMAYLRDLRCDRAQGYALGRPGPGLHFDRPSTPVEIEPDIEDTFIET